ncbi:excinuclease ABC subunit UvrC [Tepidiphilus margaritifer]|uniref:excinuclease ABC subunit UvrC n=1 Tax=Tepidiphilus margaritifer TaxID=203471 RepID=UPI00040FBB4A|nr:excinuclease ABC subunit UvrC [Tepidiphilus margaritifer]
MSFDASAFLQTVPESPGVYRMIGADETVLYVGKAKNLRRRLASYFRTRLPSPRIALMVRQIERVDISLVRSEAEALILENHLIKTLSPRYNILFRDDKSYPYIRLTGGDFPAIQTYRGALHKGERYFGPYPNGWAARESIQLVQKLFELRTCADSVFRNRSRPCLLHQIHRCTAPCVGKVSVEEYRQQVEMAARFLSGKSTEVIETLTAAMNAASERLDFEEAARLRDRLRALQSVLHQQAVDSRRDEDVDILVVIAEGGLVCVNLAMVRGGRHLGDRPLFPQQAEGAEPADVLHAFLEQHYQDRPWPDRILTNLASPELAEFVEFLAERPIAVSTGRGATDRAWLEMAEANARVAIAARLRGGERARTQLQELAAVLDLPEPPRRIECFDISHTMGEATVASCVVWEGDGMNPSQYRRYHIEGITPGDDYAAMRQVLTRRYERVAEGEAPRPDLVLIDGGKGQLEVAARVLDELGLELPLVGVAKGEARKPGLETLVFTDGRAPLQLPPSSPALHLIQIVRDEAHRFAITGHRARRAKSRTGSRLEDIPGIGPKRRKALLAAFGGLDGVKEATVEDLCRVPGIDRQLAQTLYNALHGH